MDKQLLQFILINIIIILFFIFIAFYIRNRKFKLNNKKNKLLANL